jgi:LAO/AO transport system kinase
MTGIDLDLLRNGDRRTLAKAITLSESTLDSHRSEAQDILEQVLPETGNSIRIGITGVPGVGKSTFIESFGLHLIQQDKKVAVLAVDPSSPIAGGSILGDKTRMAELSRNSQAFIRPSPTGGALGGVAQKTRETMLLCEAAGYDVVLIETVGVGQSEYEVAGMVDFFLVLMLPNAGDELQGLKKGIMELADALVINKADGDALNQAEQTRQHYQNALQLMRHAAFWTPGVMTCSARENLAIDDVWQMVCDYQSAAIGHVGIDTNSFQEKRARQSKKWMQHLLHQMLDLELKGNPGVRKEMPSLEQQVVAGKITPFAAAKKLIDML